LHLYGFFKVSSGLLAATSAVLFIIYPESVYFVFPARILAGFSHGVVYPTLLIHACEVAVPRMRGTVVATIHLCLFIGVFMTSSSLLPVYDTRTYDVDPTRTIGINGLICILTGLVIAVFFNRESPVFLIKRHKEQEAINVMIRLRSDSHETAEVRKDFDELKQMVMEDKQSNVNIFERSNIRPLAIVLVMKTIFVASFNMPLNLIWLEAAEPEFYNGTSDASGMVLSGARWITLIVMMCLIDFKRIQFYKFSVAISLAVLTTSMLVIKSSGGVLDDKLMITVLGFSFQVSSGLAIGILSDVYATEAFNTTKKPLSISMTSSFEYLLQILMIVSVYYLKNSISVILGLSAIAMSVGLVLAGFIPDTSMMSLRAARNKFRS
jgi:Sugar (and other) transporter